MHHAIEHHAAVLPPELGTVHRRVGVTQQVRARGIARVPQRNADAPGRKQLTPIHPHRCFQCPQQQPAQFHGGVGAMLTVHQQREFIAAQARNHILRTSKTHQTTRHLHQHPVARCMANTVVDPFEAVQVEEHQREMRADALLRIGDGTLQLILQMQPVGQPGQHVMHRQMRQPLLGAHALANLPAQLAIQLTQFPGALTHPLLQIGMGLHQPLPVALARKRVADGACDEHQQALIVRGEYHVRTVTLYRDDTDHFIVIEQRHTQPALRLGTEFTHHTGGDQQVDIRAGRQHRFTSLQCVFGKPVAEGTRCALAVEAVHRIDELDAVTIRRHHRHVEIAGIEQSADDAVNLRMELALAVAGHRQFGNIEQGGLQLLGATALDDLGLQMIVDVLQVPGALQHAVFQLKVCLQAVHRGQDVLGDEVQHGAFFRAITGLGHITLHDDGATDPVVAPHRHAQPIRALQAFHPFGRVLQELHQVTRRPADHAAMAQHRESQAARHFLVAIAMPGLGHEAVLCINEIEELQTALLLVAFNDVAVLRIHQRAQDAVEIGQHLRHRQVGAGQVGDLEQRLLQLLGPLQLLDLQALAHRLQRAANLYLRGALPRCRRSRRQRAPDLQQQHQSRAVLVFPLKRTGGQGRVAQPFTQRLTGLPAQHIGSRREATTALTQGDVLPRQRDRRSGRKQSLQCRQHVHDGRS
ncbi:hypothetical protein D3C81_761790 [compost metagenome]